MSETRDQMKQALKSLVIPKLRQRGFVGTFPHFRRAQSNRIDLLTFQFDRHGGGFVIELSQCSSDGFTTYWGKRIPADKVTAWDLHPKQRARLQPRTGGGTDSWYRYDAAKSVDDFTKTAELVLADMERAELMFADFQNAQKLG